MTALKKPAKTGRPTKLTKAMLEQTVKLCRLGAKDKELADFFHVSTVTLNAWKKEHPRFLNSLKKGKEESDANIANSLYHRALGYSHPEVHVSNFQGQVTLTPLTKYYPPDTGAATLWLKNRRPDLWRDRVEHTGPDGKPMQIEMLASQALKNAVRG